LRLGLVAAAATGSGAFSPAASGLPRRRRERALVRLDLLFNSPFFDLIFVLPLVRPQSYCGATSASIPADVGRRCCPVRLRPHPPPGLLLLDAGGTASPATPASSIYWSVVLVVNWWRCGDDLVVWCCGAVLCCCDYFLLDAGWTASATATPASASCMNPLPHCELLFSPLFYLCSMYCLSYLLVVIVALLLIGA
jgi:hypothetical protein